MADPWQCQICKLLLIIKLALSQLLTKLWTLFCLSIIWPKNALILHCKFNKILQRSSIRLAFFMNCDQWNRLCRHIDKACIADYPHTSIKSFNTCITHIYPYSRIITFKTTYNSSLEKNLLILYCLYIKKKCLVVIA